VEKIVIEKKQTKIFRMSMLCFLLMIVSFTLWIIGMKERKTLLSIVGLIQSVVFTISFFVYLTKTLQKKPLITITFDGIIDSSSEKSIGYIPFGDVEKFLIINKPDMKAIGIIPKNEEIFIRKLSPMKQEMARANLAKQQPPLALTLDSAKDMSLEDIYTLLKKRLNDYSCLYD
jgi:hypothetical protein